MTSAATPYSFMAINLTAASISAGLSEIFPRQCSSTNLAPSRKALISRPTNFPQTKPTWEKTLKRPPIPSGTANCSHPSRSANSWSLPVFLSVTVIKESSQKSDNSRLNTWKAAIGSTVVPDLEIIRSSTLNLRLQRPRSLRSWRTRSISAAGSAFCPAKNTCGYPFLSPRERIFQYGP